MRYDLRGRNILLTGANGFLGSHLCKGLEQEGANVIGLDVKASLIASPVDISDENEVEEFADELEKKGIKLHGLINNAAVSFKGYEIPEDKFDATMDVNLKGTNNCIAKFMPLMEWGGSVVNVASIYGVVAPNSSIYEHDPSLYNSAAYGATKAAVIQLTKYYAAHYNMVRVNAVSPGGIWQNHSDQFYQKYSSKVPMGRMGQVDQVVQPILFLLSPLSGYVNGHNLVVDGGMSIW